MRKARISVIMLFLVALFTVTTANATALLNPQSSIQPRYVGVNRAASDLTINSSGCANIYTFLSVMPNYTASVSFLNKSIQKHNNLMDCQPYAKHRFRQNGAVFLYIFWTP